jgi:hypothetical protein
MRAALLWTLFGSLVACTYAILLKGDHVGHGVRVTMFSAEILAATMAGSLIDLGFRGPADHTAAKTLVVVSVATWLIVSLSAVLAIFCFLWIYGFLLLGSVLAIAFLARLCLVRGNPLAGASLIFLLIFFSALLAISPPALPDAAVWSVVESADGILAAALLAALNHDGVIRGKRPDSEREKVADADI